MRSKERGGTPPLVRREAAFAGVNFAKRKRGGTPLPRAKPEDRIFPEKKRKVWPCISKWIGYSTHENETENDLIGSGTEIDPIAIPSKKESRPLTA